jgi:hypothetical protein
MIDESSNNLVHDGSRINIFDRKKKKFSRSSERLVSKQLMKT